MNGKAADVRFVDDGLRPRMPGRLVSIPREGLVDKHAFRHQPGIIQLRERQVLLRRRRIVSTCRGKIPRGEPRNGGRQGIDEKPVEVETMPLGGFVRPTHPVSIELTGCNPLHPNVPDVTGAVVRSIQVDGPGGHRIFGMVEELQSSAAGMAAEDGEINPTFRFSGPQRQRRAGPNLGPLGDLREIFAQVAPGRFDRCCH